MGKGKGGGEENGRPRPFLSLSRQKEHLSLSWVVVYNLGTLAGPPQGRLLHLRMRTLLLLSFVAVSALADGPKDNLPAAVRPIPPTDKAVALPETEKVALAKELAELRTAIDAAAKAQAEALKYSEFSSRYALLESKRRAKAITEEDFKAALSGLRQELGL